MASNATKKGKRSAPAKVGAVRVDEWGGMTLRDIVDFADTFGVAVSIALVPKSKKKVLRGR